MGFGKMRWYQESARSWGWSQGRGWGKAGGHQGKRGKRGKLAKPQRMVAMHTWEGYLPSGSDYWLGSIIIWGLPLKKSENIGSVVGVQHLYVCVHVYFIGLLGLVSSIYLVSHIQQDPPEFPLESKEQAFCQPQNSNFSKTAGSARTKIFICSFTDVSPGLDKSLARGKA